ncbi:hypothetical protein LOY35_22505 [Pseudomonas sp. B21-028]|nr:hypothetical protein [Pseudomonas sp. B21-028]UVL82940.1 hypothetical protein LOY35_22505 [Pseudomonas sp. B21-028]
MSLSLLSRYAFFAGCVLFTLARFAPTQSLGKILCGEGTYPRWGAQRP